MHNSTSHGWITMFFCTAFFTVAGAYQASAQYYESYSTIKTFAGKGGNPTDTTGFSGVAIDRQGNYYYTSSYKNQVYMVTKNAHKAVVIAGNGTSGYSGDGGLATDASLNEPVGVAVDSKGNIYISDRGNQRIRKVNHTDNKISTFAGNGGLNTSEGIPAINAAFFNWGIAVDGSDNLYVADVRRNVIRKIDAATGIIHTVIGTGRRGYNGDNIPAANADFNILKNFCIDGSGNFYIADYTNARIRMVTASTGLVSTIVGNGIDSPFPENTLAQDASIGYPLAVTVDAAGNLYFISGNQSIIYRYNARTHGVTTLAGSRNIDDEGFWGDGVDASKARLSQPDMVLIDKSGDLVFTQKKYQSLRKINLRNNIISNLYVEKGATAGDIGDGGNADSAQFNVPRDVAVDKNGNVYLADGMNQRIRKIDYATHTITTVAGTGEVGYSGDGGPATQARFRDPAGMAFDNAGNLLIADRYNNCIRKVDLTTGIITTVAGTAGTNAVVNIGGPATAASFSGPTDIVVDKAGNIYFSTSNDPSMANIIYKVSTNGIINFFAGKFNGIGRDNYGFGGDGGPATAAALNNPHGMVIDSNGDLIFCDKGNNVIRKIDHATGIINTIAGNGIPGKAGDGGPARFAQLSWPDDIAIAPDGNLIIADLTNNQMRLLDVTSNKLYTVAGTGAVGFGGDGGQATQALLNGVDGMAIDQNGLTYIADQFNNRIRTFTLPHIISGILPVTLINLGAKATAEDVVLQWSTTSEQNVSSFIVERSSNGQDNWKAIGKVAAAGNSSNQRDYLFTDNKVSAGKNYYRLKLINLDLTSAYSPVVAATVDRSAIQSIDVYPNPINDFVTVSIPAKVNVAGTLRIVDGAGATIITKTVNLNTGSNIITIANLSGLQSGVYYLQVNAGGNTSVLKKLLKM